MTDTIQTCMECGKPISTTDSCKNICEACRIEVQLEPNYCLDYTSESDQ